MLKKIINWLCFWKEEPCSHNWVVVESTAKTYREIIEDSGILKRNPDIEIVDHKAFEEFSIKYKGRNCWDLGRYRDYGKIRNFVCIECGECKDNHQYIIDKIVKALWEKDEQIEKETLAERVWSDKCER